MRIDSNPVVWTPAPASLQLGADEVHVWRASLDCDLPVLARLEATLSPDETVRANRFFLLTDRNHFVVARGILRELLGAYLRSSPANLQFNYGNYGKPVLVAKTFSLSLQFNLSHSGGLAVYAFSLGRRLGIDVEQIRPQLAGEDIARRYFADARACGTASASAAIAVRRVFPLLDTEGSLCKGTGGRPEYPAGQLYGIPNAGPAGGS